MKASELRKKREEAMMARKSNSRSVDVDEDTDLSDDELAEDEGEDESEGEEDEEREDKRTVASRPPRGRGRPKKQVRPASFSFQPSGDRSLAEWISDSVMQLADKSGDVPGSVKIRLRQHGQDGSRDTVETWQFSPKSDSEEAIAENIIGRGQSDSEEMGCTTYSVDIQGVEGRYALSYREDEDMLPGERGLVRAAGGHHVAGFGGMPHRFGPGGMGPSLYERTSVQLIGKQLEQQIAHNQFMFENSMGMFGDTLRMFKQVISEQNDTIRTQVRERIKSVDVFEELASRKHEREVEILQEKRKDEAFSKVSQLAVGVIHGLVGTKLLGAGGPNGQSSPLAEMFGSFVSTIRPEQLHSLMRSGILDGDQQMLFVQLLELIQQEQAREAQRKQNGATSSAPPPG